MTETAVQEARRRLGRIGAALTVPIAPADAWRRAASRVEGAGYGSIWTNEAIGGRETFAHLGMLLAATDRLIAGSGIANTWARHPAVMQGGAAVLADAYPGRLMLGIGASLGVIVEQSGQVWRPPLARMREYLDSMDAAADLAPQPSVPFPRLLAALGPKMLELARDRADGALPAALPVEHTRRAREILGPDKLLVVTQGAVLDDDPGRARGALRQMGMLALPDSPYARAMRGLGYAEADLSDGGSDEVIDAMTAWGDAGAIANRIFEHLDAGADHVCVTPVAADLDTAADQLEKLAPALLDR